MQAKRLWSLARALKNGSGLPDPLPPSCQMPVAWFDISAFMYTDMHIHTQLWDPPTDGYVLG